jgi:hypothetical protein
MNHGNELYFKNKNRKVWNSISNIYKHNANIYLFYKIVIETV